MATLQVSNPPINIDDRRSAGGFFMLPLEEKQKYALVPGTFQGYGQALVFSEDQKLDWCNMFGLSIETPRLPHLWPQSPAGFR
ncbi:hypothetical protein JHK85_020226 [Glycine max]|nr:hypothetical protein JHK85_020226 [Glycine max]